ncbi:uncharacterized protein At5g49945 [Carya illinoinensis]|uniref:Coiled-coil domain-containing protein 47 n=1 Tax=Carya illinoinensis TaxID=32201 RepID=A0A8T1QDG7_CARIL|nr:uncharacterized protein At5g49945 [Carya illinoinensis]KAG6652429.1 hypothetical protein CIPAW_05G005700 [Carya illinoinensis]KAG6652430.1 hypothetical protein CIPAW_05G005700 [Carya illinoinensis]
MANRSLLPSSLLHLLALLSLLNLLLSHLSRSLVLATDSHFEGFDSEDADADADPDSDILYPNSLRSPSLTLSDPDPSRLSPPDPVPDSRSPPSSSDPPKPSYSSFDDWDEDEFEGLPILEEKPIETPIITEDATPSDSNSKPSASPKAKPTLKSYTAEIVCGTFLIMFLINYFTGKRENESLALAWAAKFATKNSIFERNFSLLGVGEGDDSPLLLKEGQTMFKFYASGRRCCQGLLATMELKSRHDLISRLYNLVVPCKDEIAFEVYMNEDAMDHVVLAVSRKKAAKVMQKEVRDLQKFAGMVSPPTSGRKWVSEELAVLSESKEVAGDLITDAVLDQVFGEKAFEKFGKYFISMHFSDQHPGTHKKMLLFKFALPDANNVGDMTRLVALVPYYIDLIGRYKLSSQARSKTEAARLKAAQEAHKELQNARQEALQKKKAERKKLMEEAEAQLSAESIRKKEAKDRARQTKKGMPKIKMSRAH